MGAEKKRSPKAQRALDKNLENRWKDWSPMKRRDTTLESEGAEYLVLVVEKRFDMCSQIESLERLYSEL